MVIVAATACLLMMSGRLRMAGVVSTVGAVVMIGPLPVVACGAAVVVAVVLSRARRKAAEATEDASDELLAVEITSLGVVSGMSFRAAAQMAADETEGSTKASLLRALRRVNTGLDPRLQPGPLTQLFAEANRSTTTGSTLAPALDSLSRSVRADRSAASKERINKLPVKLLFPLAFLILPGFVLMTVAPAVVNGLSRVSL